MRKRIFLIFCWLFIIVLITGCKNKSVDYSNYDFVNVNWTRETEYDTEYLSFLPNGNFSYYCACGEPVNDSDLCETYTYNNETKTINLNCYETTSSMIKTIKIIKYDENTLELDFDGDIRKFTKEEN